ncbi:MAG: RNA polymerase factor sigma-54 [Treponema sp.]
MLQMNQSIGQQLVQKMTQTQIQGLELLAMPETDLYQKIIREVEENPALELADSKRSRQSLSSKTPRAAPTYFDNQTPARSHKSTEDSDAFQSFIENIPESRIDTLQMHLLEQIRLEPLPATIAACSERIIQNLDTNGFHIVPLHELFASETQLRSKPHYITQALKIVQQLEPIGCATKNSAESLVVQAKIRFADKLKTEPIYTYTIDILEHHFSYLENVRTYLLVQKINKNAAIPYKITQEQAAQILYIIRTLNPFPGRAYSASDSKIDYIIPTAFIERQNQTFIIRMNNVYLPPVHISQEILSLVGEHKQDKSVQEYIKPQLQKAKVFIGSLNNREKTILAVLKQIIKAQERFFITGNVQHLVPLTQQYIAQTIDVHESTVSRAVSNKYIQCVWGIFEIKFFFTSAAQTVESESERTYTKQAVKLLLQQLLSTHSQKISDQKLSELLQNEHGIKIARRTINKYRKELLP